MSTPFPPQPGQGPPPPWPPPPQKRDWPWWVIAVAILVGVVLVWGVGLAVAASMTSSSSSSSSAGSSSVSDDSSITPLGCVVGSDDQRDCTEIRMIETACNADLSSAQVRLLSTAAPSFQVTWTDGSVPVGQIIVIGPAAGESSSGVTIISQQSACRKTISLDEWVALSEPGTEADLPPALR